MEKKEDSMHTSKSKIKEFLLLKSVSANQALLTLQNSYYYERIRKSERISAHNTE